MWPPSYIIVPVGNSNFLYESSLSELSPGTQVFVLAGGCLCSIFSASYWHETLSFIVKEKQRLTVFVDRALRRTFRPHGEELSGGYKQLHQA
jgi:hypothetical protein